MPLFGVVVVVVVTLFSASSSIARSKKLPKRFLNYRVFNGDKSDLRFNDPKNVIVGLYAKGRALKDQTGFVQDV